MVKELQQFDFTDNTFGVNQVLECFGNFFDCHLDLGIVVISRADDTVSAMADLLDIFEFFFDNERRA